jgi:hypothetical protein
MGEVQNPSVIERVQLAAQGYGIKRIAAELNKAPSTVYSELNPWGDRSKAKLGFEDAIEIMRLTGDYTPLVEAAASLGLAVVTESPVPDKSTSREEGADDLRALYEMQDAMAQNMAPSYVQTLAGRACDDIQQTAVKYTEEWAQ